MIATRLALSKIGLYVAGAGVVLLVVLILAELVATQVLHVSLPYALEYSEYLVPIVAFWGAIYTLGEHAHVEADILLHRMSASVRRWAELVGCVLGLLFLAAAFLQMWDMTLRSFTTNRLSFYPETSPLWPPQLMVTLGLGLFIVLLFLETFVKAVSLFRKEEGGVPLLVEPPTAPETRNVRG